MDVLNELKELGLDDHEVRVYLACLALGRAKVNDISKKAELIRTTTYGILRSLQEKGLVSTITVEGIIFFQAATPKQLIELLEEKKEKITAILPKLEALRSVVPVAHKIELFEGLNGVKTVLNDLVAIPNQDVLLIGAGKKWMEFSNSYRAMYYRKKKENNIHVKAIISDTPEERTATGGKTVNTQTRFIKNLEASGSLCIYNDKLAFVDYEEGNLRGFIIQDKHLTKIQTFMFEHLWKQARP